MQQAPTVIQSGSASHAKRSNCILYGIRRSDDSRYVRCLAWMGRCLGSSEMALIVDPACGIDRYSEPRAPAFISSGYRAAIMSSGSQGGVGQHFIPRFLFVGACLVGVGWATAWPLPAQQEKTFPEGLYLRLEAQNCRACHNSSGVASNTRLHFPESGASRGVIMAFGLELAQLVDRSSPDSSLLLLKPTNRIPHTGGPLIEVGSEDERMLASWVQFLASRPPTLTDSGHHGAKQVREPLRRLTHAQYDNTVRDLVGDRTRPARSFPPRISSTGIRTRLRRRQSRLCSPRPTPLRPRSWRGTRFDMAMRTGWFPASRVIPETGSARNPSCADSV